MTETNHTDKTISPIDYLSINIGPNVGDNDMLIKARVIPVGRNGNKIIGKTLTYGETDSGDTITIRPGEKLLFPAGNINISIQDIDRENRLEPDGYAPISNTVWTWLRCGKPANPNLFRFLFAVARRLDTAHTLCTNAINELGVRPDEPYIQTRARIFKSLRLCRTHVRRTEPSNHNDQGHPVRVFGFSSRAKYCGHDITSFRCVSKCF